MTWKIVFWAGFLVLFLNPLLGVVLILYAFKKISDPQETQGGGDV